MEPAILVQSKLTLAELDALWAAKRAGGLKPNTVRLMRATLRRALHDAEGDGLVTRNVAALSTPPRIEPPDGRTLTVEQARALLEAARGDRLAAAYVLVLAFGLRRAELLGLAWADLDVSAGLLAVRQQVTIRKSPQAADGKRTARGVLELSALKTGSKGRRTLELTPEVIELLQSHRALQDRERATAGVAWQESGLIFTSPAGAPIEPSSFSHAFSAMAQRAGLGRWHVHEARHTAASLMLAMGTKLEIVSRVLGHSSVTVTADVYSHLLGGEKRQAAAAMTAALLGRPGTGSPRPSGTAGASNPATCTTSAKPSRLKPRRSPPVPVAHVGSQCVGRSHLAPILGSQAARPRRPRTPCRGNATHPDLHLSGGEGGI